MISSARSTAIATAIAAAMGGVAFAQGTYAQGDAGEQVYLKIELENVQITSYQLGVLDNRIAGALAAAKVKYTPAGVSAASREAMSKLGARLGAKTGTATVVVCVPPGSKTCIEIACQLCTGG
jgi:hypothetical protein